MKQLTVLKKILEIGNEQAPPEILDVLRKVWPDKVDNMTMLEAVIRSIYFESLRGEKWAAEFLASYLADDKKGKRKDTFNLDG